MGQTLITIAKIRTGYMEKFGIPRQSGLVESSIGEIVFEPEYRNVDALKGLEEYSHIWLLWGFSEARRTNREGFCATVSPPRLGGKIKKGVFATRSPFRPNSIGLSSVRLKKIDLEAADGPILVVEGADLLNGTPIYDIKPYIAYTDAHVDARCSFASDHFEDGIRVEFAEELKAKLPDDLVKTVYEILSQDPRAAYNKKPDYLYGMNYAGYDIRFKVVDDVLEVYDVVEIVDSEWSKVK